LVLHFLVPDGGKLLGYAIHAAVGRELPELGDDLVVELHARPLEGQTLSEQLEQFRAVDLCQLVHRSSFEERTHSRRAPWSRSERGRRSRAMTGQQSATPRAMPEAPWS